MIGSTAPSDSTELVRSKGCAVRFLNSGSNTGASTIKTTIAGRFIKNTEPHQKRSSRMPASTGPSEIPPVITALHTAIALARCPASWNMFRTSASVDGMSVAPPMPRLRGTRVQVTADERHREVQH
ncbi:MAG TPA: hypothetical protein VFE19_01720 [Jatrophihabitantaceae bacterium]|nr:hypothetical protein [Jatrophihabitantaceae bacterium]